MLEAAAKQFYRVEWKASRQSWSEVLRESLGTGAGLVHQLTKHVDAVMPHVLVDGLQVVDPEVELHQAAGTWAAQWQAAEADDGHKMARRAAALLAVSPAAPLPAISLGEARAAAKGFKVATAVVDGVLPRHPGYLAESSLASTLRLLGGFEVLGVWPDKYRTHMFKLIPKPRGGPQAGGPLPGAVPLLGSAPGGRAEGLGPAKRFPGDLPAGRRQESL